MIAQTDIPAFPQDLILFPSTYQNAVEASINVPLPEGESLTPSQKILTLLHEIKRVNFSIEYYKEKQAHDKIEDLKIIKDFFTTMLQEIMATQFQVVLSKQAA